MAKNEVLREVLKVLENQYGDLNNQRGCYVANDNTGHYEWLSVADIVRIIEEVDESYSE